MKILLVTATKMEMDAIPVSLVEDDLNRKEITVTRLVTSPGILCTAYHMGKIFTASQFDFAINAGIAGSFNRNLELGSVIKIQREILADMGAEDGNELLSAFDINLFERDEFPFINGALLNETSFPNSSLKNIPGVTGITVNTVHGNEESIGQIIRKYNPDVESMEGGAFFYACLLNQVPFCEVRAISNYVEKRDRSKWKIKLALDNLGFSVKKILLDF